MFDGLDFPGDSGGEDAGPATTKRSRTATLGTAKRHAPARAVSGTPASFAAASSVAASSPAAPANLSPALQHGIRFSGSLSADAALAQMIQAQAHAQQTSRTPDDTNTSQALALVERSSAAAPAVTITPDAPVTRAAAPPGNSELHCGICGATPSSAPWCYEACLGGRILELTSACTLCVSGVQVVCPSLSWAQAEQLASLSPAFKTGIPMAGKINQALVPQVRTQKQFMEMVGGLAKHGHEVGDAFSRVCLALDVKPATSEPSLGAGDELPSGAEDLERRLARTPQGKPAPKRARASASGSSSLPSALMQFDGKGKIARQAISAEATPGASEDKHSLAYHSKKVNLEAILSGKEKKPGNIINAVEKAGNALMYDHTGLRKTEGAALQKLARVAAAADLLAEKKQSGLDHHKFMHNVRVLKEAQMRSYPPPWCRLVWRRILMQTDDPKAFVGMVSAWAPATAFDPEKPQLMALPAEDGERNCAFNNFQDAILGDLMANTMQPALSTDKLHRMWCIAQELYTELEANSAVVTETLGAETFACFQEVATVLCAVSALIPPNVLSCVNRPSEVNLQGKTIIEALKIAKTGSETGTGGQAHRIQIAELLQAPPWAGLADVFLTTVLSEAQHVAKRDGLIAKMGGAAGDVSKADVEVAAATLQELHPTTRPAWIQPLATAFVDFALQAGESAKTSDSAKEVCLARSVLQSVLDLTKANILQASPDAATALLQHIEPRAIELEREADESRFTKMADTLRNAIGEGNVTFEQVLEVRSWPRWAATPSPKVAEALEKLVGTTFSYAGAERTEDRAVCQDASLEVLEELLLDTPLPAQGELLRATKAMRSASVAKVAFANLEESKGELNQKKRSSMVKSAIKSLESTKAALKNLDEIQPVLSRLGAESAFETLQVAMTERDTVLLNHLHARRQHCEAAMVSATSDLKACNQGGAGGKSWYEGIADDDLAGLQRLASKFFQEFSPNDLQPLVKKTRAATKAYKEALYEPDLASLAEASSAAAALPPSVFDATAAIERAEITMHEAHMLAAVCTGGDEGRNQCRTCLDNLVASELSVEKVHPALMKEVYRLLGQGKK